MRRKIKESREREQTMGRKEKFQALLDAILELQEIRDLGWGRSVNTQTLIHPTVVVRLSGIDDPDQAQLAWHLNRACDTADAEDLQPFFDCVNKMSGRYL